LLALFGIALVSSRVAQFGTQSLARLGNWLSNHVQLTSRRTGVAGSFVLGIATGLLWAPCAGPILGLILTTAALKGASLQTTVLLLAFAGGAATSLGLALSVSAQVSTSMKRLLGVSDSIQKAVGIVVLCGVSIIAPGLDTGLLARASYASTAALEQSVIDHFSQSQESPETADAIKVGSTAVPPGQPYRSPLPTEGHAPALDGAAVWLNSPPLSMEQLRGKVVLIEFWTYSCINCIRTVPYVRAWAEKYKDQGLVVIGVHTPEFAFEKNPDNVRKAAAGFKIDYPVAIDNDYRIWRAFSNSYWPAHYLIDSDGQIRYHHFGEGSYRQTEQAIRDLLKEAGEQTAALDMVQPAATGVQARADPGNIGSPETYLGYGRATGFSSSMPVAEDRRATYSLKNLTLNQWGLSGNWTVGAEQSVLNSADGSVSIRFRARDLHLVMGPAINAGPIEFKVTMDGQIPGADHGSDTDANGNGTVQNTRLYHLVRQSADVKEHEFEIRFLKPGVAVYAFTFG
jgi:thiol-disulfide isomerase/thioredoxin